MSVRWAPCSRLRVPVIAVLAGSVLAPPHLIVNSTERYRRSSTSWQSTRSCLGWLAARIAQAAWPMQLAASIAGAAGLAILAWTLETGRGVGCGGPAADASEPETVGPVVET